jgi:hypothetical protein
LCLSKCFRMTDKFGREGEFFPELFFFEFYLKSFGKMSEDKVRGL